MTPGKNEVLALKTTQQVRTQELERRRMGGFLSDIGTRFYMTALIARNRLEQYREWDRHSAVLFISGLSGTTFKLIKIGCSVTISHIHQIAFFR